MIDIDKVIWDIERCICHVPDACKDCSHDWHDATNDCMEKLLADALEVLKEQKAQLEKYHKADTFLAVHGWKWK